MLKATFIGNLGGDPEMRYSAGGAGFLRFNVASTFRIRTPEGEWQDKTEWLRVTVFGQRAESLNQHLRKGMRVFVSGRLEARPWTDREAQVRAGLEVVADDVEFVSQRSPDFDTSDLPASTSVTSERPAQRRVPQETAVFGPQPRGAGAAVADQDVGDLQDLPF
jgi:single-strand DNA-binding protein